MKIFSIYKATNKSNGKVYIGFDSNWPARINEHNLCSLNKNSHEYNYYFHRAIRLYGWNNFSWEIICQHQDSEFLLKIMEPYFIDAYDSYMPNGYNMTKGGQGKLGYICSKQTKEKLSILGKNRKHSKKTKEKMSNSAKGKPKSEKHKQFMNGNSYRAKKYLLISAEGIEYKITNLRKFCKENLNYNLNYFDLIKLSNKKIKSYKGWKCIKL